MKPLPQQVEQNILRRQLLEPGERVLVAVSGGLDSMVLLHLLFGLAQTHRWRLAVAHFNHKLRGRASDADERLVRRVAAGLELPITVKAGDVRGFARRHKLSLEMAARQLRHEFLARTAARRSSPTVALAHHADDQLELFFMRLLRGAGTEGLGGMKWSGPSPVESRLRLVRPLLDCPKSVLAAWAAANQVRHREDASNQSLDFQRNRIRHQLLPVLRQFQPALDQVVARLMNLLEAESTLAGAAAREWLAGVASRSPAVAPFDQLPLAVQRRCIQLQLASQGIGADYDLIEQLRENRDLPVSVPAADRRSAPENVCLTQSGMLQTSRFVSPAFDLRSQRVTLAGVGGKLLFADVEISWKRSLLRSRRIPVRRRSREAFDADRVGCEIVLRHWRPGDRFQPIGMSQPVKLQDLFTNLKVPRTKRHRLVLASTAAGEIFWVQNLRISERFKLTDRTTRSLQWAWKRP